MDLNSLKALLQSHLSDGLVIVVGSGLSAAEGIPGMGQLATHLQGAVPANLPAHLIPEWKAVADLLASGIDLESALSHTPALTNDLEQIIVATTYEFISGAEAKVAKEVFAGTRTLRFSRLLKHLLTPNTGIPVITTNYDRLIELAAEHAGLGVDTMFVGTHLGKLDPKGSQYSQCRDVKSQLRTFVRIYADHIVLLKPHGSLDWAIHDGSPVRSVFTQSNCSLIITPGTKKYRGGYDPPFDSHRERANREIDKGARYLIIGYGFNDDHLQTHLEAELSRGKPAVMLARSITPRSRTIAETCSHVTAIFESTPPGGTTVIHDRNLYDFPATSLWDLGNLIDEVF